MYHHPIASNALDTTIMIQFLLVQQKYMFWSSLKHTEDLEFVKSVLIKKKKKSKKGYWVFPFFFVHFLFFACQKQTTKKLFGIGLEENMPPKSPSVLRRTTNIFGCTFPSKPIPKMFFCCLFPKWKSRKWTKKYGKPQ